MIWIATFVSLSQKNTVHGLENKFLIYNGKDQIGSFFFFVCARGGLKELEACWHVMHGS